MIPMQDYDHFLVFYSGGKDSTATLLHLLEQGVPVHKIELWHHLIDGRDERLQFMDWPCTEDYCRAIAALFGIPIFYSWRIGGFYAELTKSNQRSNPVMFEVPEGGTGTAGGIKGSISTRMQFPQQSANLSVRWCSSSLKIEVAQLAITNQERFTGKKLLVLSGERAEESAARSRYAVFEPHRTDARASGKRLVDHWRPIHAWDEGRVWEIIKQYSINPHPAYWLGFGRTSCQFCIFGSKNQWATNQKISPERFDVIAELEHRFGKTIHRGGDPVEIRAYKGQVYDFDPAWIPVALSKIYTEPVRVPVWTYPPGAFGESAGPT